MTESLIKGDTLANMFREGTSLLKKNVKKVDALNVFPVPDGDTGTNMNLTISSGCKELENASINQAGHVAQSFSKGLLMGARGNSGVILSQLFRGFAKAIETKAELDGFTLSQAFERGVETAYKAVMKPVEGTILTVAKDAAKAGSIKAKHDDSALEVLEAIVTESQKALERTPNQLPVLKEVGVVDSGGQGLVYIYQGMLAGLKGETISDQDTTSLSMDELVRIEHHQNAQSHMSTEGIEYGYCTEVMVKMDSDVREEYVEDRVRQELSEHGDSLLVVSDEDLIKIHIHAEYPGEVLSFAQRYGSLIHIKIENMREQHAALLHQPAKPAKEERITSTSIESKKEFSPYGIVTVAMGAGVSRLFESLGADVVITGGQTMNPSTEDIVNAIKKAHAKVVFVLPNNSNIVMAANQASEVSDVEVIVLPTKSIPQGLSALFAFQPEQSLDDNKTTMIAAIEDVKSGEVTYAVRDTTIDGKAINKGDFMGISEKNIITTGTSMERVTTSLIDDMVDEDAEIVTLIQGEDADESLTERILAYIENGYEDVEVESHVGNQPLYPFIIAVE